MNKSKLANHEICKKCGKCCMVFTEYVYESNKDLAMRYKMLDTDLVEVKKFGKYYRIMWKIPCKHLKKDKDGNYYCDIYNTNKRPWFCETYPDHCFDDIDILNGESEICPIIRIQLNKKVKPNEHP